MLRHAEYEKTAIEILIILKKAKKTEDKSLFELENRQQFDFIIARCKYLINYIKKNNNATFIGTIQTTEEINRVSEKILISEETINVKTSPKGSKDDYEKDIFQFSIIQNYIDDDKQSKTTSREYKQRTTQKTPVKQQKKITPLLEWITENLTTTEQGNKLFITNLEKITQILNSQDKHYLKCKTKKQKDIDSMITSIETAFPYMAQFIDEDKLGYIWFLINNDYNTTNEVEMDNAITQYKKEYTAEVGNKNEPILRKSTIEQGIKLRDNSLHLFSKVEEKAQKINVWFKNNNYRIITNSENAQRDFNIKIIDNLKNQPSLEYLETDVLGIPRKKIINILADRKKNFEVKGDEAVKSIKSAFIRKLGANGYKPSLMNILSTDEFTTTVYGEYVYETAIQSEWNKETGSFNKFTPFQLSEFRSNLNNGDYKVAPSKAQRGGDGRSTEIIGKIDKMIAKIQDLDGISQPKDPPQYLAEINDEVTKLQNHLTELYSGDDIISAKLQEALRQLEEASRGTSSDEN